MNTSLIKAVVALVPGVMLACGSLLLFTKARTGASFLQVLGAGFLLLVVLAHLFEALQLFPGMRWGLERSAGHYVDLCSAVMGLALFPFGYLLHALSASR